MTELEQAREIIRDLLAERGLPQWLADIATEREALVSALDQLRTSSDQNQRECCFTPVTEAHDADCETRRLLRLLVPGETQHQVNEDHQEALATNFYGPVTVPPAAPQFTRLVGLSKTVEFMEDIGRGILPVGP